MNRGSIIRGGGWRVALVLVWALAGLARADVVTWTNTAAGYWTNGANWSGGVAPVAIDDVFVTNGSATITIDEDVTVNSLTITGTYAGTITFKTGVVANLTVSTDLTLKSGATIQPTFSSLVGHGTGRVITVYGDATIDGTINGTGCGFLSYLTVVGSQGPGFVQWSACHGGLGSGGNVYGSMTEPTSLGSGNYNGRGGGAVKLAVTGTLTVNGTVTMDADSSSYSPAGGSIWIECATLAGSGILRANAMGGASYVAGGGRIALIYTTKTYTGTVSVKGISGGQPGSLWEPGLFTNGVAEITLNNAQYQYFFPSTLSNCTWGLTVTNGANVYFHDFTNGVLTLTNLVVAGASTLRFDVNSAGALLRRDINRLSMPSTPVSVLGSSKLALPSQVYTCSTFTVSAGSVVYASMGDTNAINAESGGTAGTRHGSGIAFYCDTATIGGTIEVSRTGFPATKGPGGATKNWDGGSYGGLGGGQSTAPTAPCYGNLTRPSALGSGGTQPGGVHYAGGAVTLVATDALTVNGAILADGGSDPAYDGDSGGSIWLVTGTLSGTGRLSAVGGRGNLTGSHGGGGGGRIAMEYVSSTFAGSVSVARGAALSSAYPARTGTLFQCQSPYPGACSLGYGGLQLDSSYSVRSNDVKIARQVTSWIPGVPRVVWTDTSTRFGDNTVTNVATYTLSGMPTNKGVEILTNNVVVATTNTGPAGTMTFSVDLAGPRTVTVALGGMGAAESLPPTNVTTTSATLVGSLASTGWYDTAAMTFWGPTDDGENPSAWSNACVFPAPQPLGVFSTNVALPALGEYFYRCAASNEAGLAWADHSEYVVAGVTVAAVPVAIGERDETARFWVSREPAATSRAVTVSFLIGGSASNLTDYTLSLASNVTLAGGVSSNAVQVLSSPDGEVEADETVILTLTAASDAFYGIGTPGAATLTITNSPPMAITWTNASSGYWTNGANWSGGLAPTAADDVFIDAGSATITIDQDVEVSNLSVTGAYSGAITFKAGAPGNLTVYGGLYLKSGATIQPTYSSLLGNGTGRVITVSGDAAIDGTIDGTGCGFLRSDTNPGFQGPGYSVSYSAAHGGLASGAVPIYGSLTQPTSLGSGDYNGRGGGAIKLKVTGALTVNGTIAMDSDNSTYAAAGGSIWLDCGTLAGNGILRANAVGGATYPGAGGRISLTYTSQTYTGSVSVRGTPGAQPGSLWYPGLFTNPVAAITLNNAQYQYFFPSSASNHTWGLTVTNGANVYFHNFTNGVLSLTNLVVAGGSTLRFDVNSAGALQKWGINRLGMPYTPVSVVGTSFLGLSSLSYTCSTFTVAAGSVIYASIGDTTATNADSGGTGGNPHGAGISFYCDSATIDGTIEASSMGFTYTLGPGGATKNWDGGSYGGLGGAQATAPTAPCYGSLTRPTALGSGGSYPSSSGGGAVRIVATNGLTLNGAVRANGAWGGGYTGGSGGSLWLVAGALSGTGVVSAAGGNGSLSDSHGAGGGGRIAMEYVTSTFAGSVSVARGTALSSAYPARTGTLFQCQSPYPGACSLGYGGIQLTSAYSVSTNDVKIVRTVLNWDPRGPQLVWTESSTRVGGAAVPNTGIYGLAGLRANSRVYVYSDNALLLSTNASGTGSVTFNVALDVPRTILVRGPSGSIYIVR